MSQKIEASGIDVRKVVAGGSRYLSNPVIYYGERPFVTFPIYVRKNYVPTGAERVHVIMKGEEYRPDLVSYDFYGFPDYWWRILEVNKMKDIWEFESGKTIMLPEVAR